MITEKTMVTIESVFDSENKSHRYSLKKVWNDKLKQAAVISIAPSSDSGVSTDLTTQLVQNNLDKLGFGGFVLTNLCSASCDFKKLKSVDGLFDKTTDKVILDSCAKSDVIIICWGAVANKNKLLSKRAEEVIKLITKYASKIHFLSDGTRAELHPLTPALRHYWELVQAKFTNEVPVGSWDGSIEVTE